MTIGYGVTGPMVYVYGYHLTHRAVIDIICTMMVRL